jgi:hypothetical protein
MKKGSPTAEARVRAPDVPHASGEIESPVDVKHLVMARLRGAEDLIRTARLRVLGDFPAQGPEVLDDVREATKWLSEVRTLLLSMHIKESTRELPES